MHVYIYTLFHRYNNANILSLKFWRRAVLSDTQPTVSSNHKASKKYSEELQKIKYGYNNSYSNSTTAPLLMTRPPLHPSMQLQSSALSAVSWHPPASGSRQPHAGMWQNRSRSTDPSYLRSQSPNSAEHVHQALCHALCTWHRACEDAGNRPFTTFTDNHIK